MDMHEKEQARMALAIRDNSLRNLSRLPQLTAPVGVDTYSRLAIYRNNTYTSLTAALLAAFPVTARLIDERYFSYVAYRFILDCPPDEPRLSQFGAAFPQYLRNFERLSAMPVVAETARLEWQIAIALDRRIEAATALSSVMNLESPELATLRLQPSLRLFVSRWPVFSVWAVHQQYEEPDLDFASRRKGERVMLWRMSGNIRLVTFRPAEFAFIRLIAKGETIENAALRALSRDPLFDLTAMLGLLFGNGLVTDVGNQQR